MIPVEILIPESMRAVANQLAACKGLSMDDLRTFGEATHERDGVRYILVGVQVSEGWLAGMASPPSRPAFDTDNQVDLAAAASAMVGMVVNPQAGTEPLPAPTALVVQLGGGLTAAYGLTEL